MPSLGKIGKIVRRSGEKSEISKASRASENQTSKIYLKAMPLRKLSDLNTVKREVKSGKILILKVSPLADKSIEDIKRAINELCEFVKTVGGDIARLGEERIVITPSGVRIWREKTVAPEEQVPTAA
ncbi:MAG: cell division protein SepF [Candidatus Bathyarchaeota archaeon]|nr:cell division protein SepF [Candidatus Bathyarchaeota archaeon]